MYERTKQSSAAFCRLQVEALEPRHLMAGYTAESVLNINPGATGSDPKNFTAVGDIVFFTASTANKGTELWRTDGTATGTRIVKDIALGSLSSNPAYLTNVGGTLYFAANDRIHGKELWKSNGTAAGTVKIPDIQNGQGGSYPRWLTNVNGTLFFTAFEKSVGRELHRLSPIPNQNPAATLVKDLVSSTPPSSSADHGPTRLTEVNGELLFAINPIGGLFRSDGTSAGTEEILYEGHSFRNVREAMNVSGTLFFSASNTIDSRLTGFGVELWRTDGTTAGTLLVKDLWSGAFYCGYHGEGPCSFYDSRPRTFANANGSLFFSATVSTDPRVDFLKTDGTAAGTKLLRAFEETSTPSDDHVKFTTSVGNDVYFSGATPTQGRELWKTNGTVSGTKIVKEIASGSFSGSPASLTNHLGQLIFTAYDNTHGQEIWMSDGSAVGTQLIRDIRPGKAPSSPRHLTNVNGTLYFSANDGIHGSELWKLVKAPLVSSSIQQRSEPFHAIVDFGDVKHRNQQHTISPQVHPLPGDPASPPNNFAPMLDIESKNILSDL